MTGLLVAIAMAVLSFFASLAIGAAYGSDAQWAFLPVIVVVCFIVGFTTSYRSHR